MPVKNLTNMVFDRLKVLERDKSIPGNTHAIWKCQCSCGEITYVSSANLVTGMTKSCGCLRKEKTRITGLNRKGKKKNKKIA
jgi:hypothetical protein